MELLKFKRWAGILMLCLAFGACTPTSGNNKVVDTAASGGALGAGGGCALGATATAATIGGVLLAPLGCAAGAFYGTVLGGTGGALMGLVGGNNEPAPTTATCSQLKAEYRRLRRLHPDRELEIPEHCMEQFLNN